MGDAPEVRGAHAPGGVAAAREALLAWVDQAGDQGRAFLQVSLRRTASGRYRVRHLEDDRRPAAELATHTDPFAARDLAQTTESGEHRPLKTSPNLRRGWSLDELDGRGLWTALEYLYPACAVHWHAGREGTLRVTQWADTAGRQSGIYSAVGLLPEPAVRDAVRACCADAVCLRRVAWGVSDADPAPLEPDSAGADAGRWGERVPCPEACSMFVSFARKVLTVERAPRRELDGLGRLSDEELEQIRQVVGAAASGTVGAAREGEFDEPLNLRRIRYLAARLGTL